MDQPLSKKTSNRFKGLAEVTEASGHKEARKGLWVRVMRGMCPDGFIVAVKEAVFWGREAAQLWSNGGGGGGGTIGGDTTRGEQRWENGK